MIVRLQIAFPHGRPFPSILRLVSLHPRHRRRRLLATVVVGEMEGEELELTRRLGEEAVYLQGAAAVGKGLWLTMRVEAESEHWAMAAVAALLVVVAATTVLVLIVLLL